MENSQISMRPNPGTRAETVSLAREAVENNDWAAASDLWQLCIDNYSTGEQPWWEANLGRALSMNLEFDQAEMASGRTRTNGGSISLDNNTDTHAHFAKLHLTGSGVAGH